MIFIGIAVMVIIAVICIVSFIPKKKSYMSFKASNDLVGLPIITFYNNTNKLHFLLDTGADRSAFSKDHLNLVEHKVLNVEGTLTDAGGHTVNVGVALMRLHYENQVYDNLFQLVDMKPISNAIDLQVKGQRIDILGVIGDDFLTKYKYVLDFSKMVAYSK